MSLQLFYIFHFFQYIIATIRKTAYPLEFITPYTPMHIYRITGVAEVKREVE